MIETSHAKEVGLAAITAQPKIRIRAVLFFGACLAALAFTTYAKPQPYRAAYGVLGTVTAVALVVQYRRENALVSNRLLAEAVVTDWGRPVRSRSRFLDAILSRFSGNIPVMKYSFVAFDQKTYTGQTGWGARRLYIGAHVPVLYEPGNPARNHPLNGFVFYSFRNRNRQTV